MTSSRKASLTAGIFYLLTFVSIPTLSLYSQVHGPNYIVGVGCEVPPDTPESNLRALCDGAIRG